MPSETHDPATPSGPSSSPAGPRASAPPSRRRSARAGGTPVVLDVAPPPDGFESSSGRPRRRRAPPRPRSPSVAARPRRPRRGVVTAAGTDACGDILDVDAEAWDRVVTVNLLGTVAVVRAALPHLERNHGRVVTVASTLGLRALPAATAYCASKFGVVGFTRALALEAGRPRRRHHARPRRDAHALLRRPPRAVQAGRRPAAQRPVRRRRRRRLRAHASPPGVELRELIMTPPASRPGRERRPGDSGVRPAGARARRLPHRRPGAARARPRVPGRAAACSPPRGRSSRWPRLAGCVDEAVDTGRSSRAPTPHGADVAVNLHGRGPQSTALLRATHPRRLIAFAALRDRTPSRTAGAGVTWRPDEHEVARWCRLLRESGHPRRPAPTCDLRAGAPAPRTRPARRSSIPGRGERRPALARRALGRGRRAARARPGGRGHRRARRSVELAPRGRGRRRPAGRAVLAGTPTSTASRPWSPRAGRVVCGDTGVAHLATAFGTPSVVLFGPTPPRRVGPAAGRPRHVRPVGRAPRRPPRQRARTRACSRSARKPCVRPMTRSSCADRRRFPVPRRPGT